MKAVILAGGLGTRLSEETVVKPKPMVEIGGRPILWHIMKGYSAHGVNTFVVCLGYKGYLIKEYFANYFLHMSDVTFDIANNQLEVLQANAEPWRVTLVDTGDETMTGGRLRRVAAHLGPDDFCFTYGDGVADVDITGLIAFHRQQGRLATVTAVRRPESGRYPGHGLRGEAARRGVDQRRLLRVVAARPRVHRRGCHHLGARADGAAGERGTAGGLRSRGVLAADGHAARQDEAGGTVGDRPGPVEGLGMTGFGGIYRGRRVLVTGHTGFKGSWLTLWLKTLGAEVTGLALAPPSTPSHWDLVDLDVEDRRVDIRDVDAVEAVVGQRAPEIVFHLAAQPLVRRSYRDPLETWSTNVMGTANVLEACRRRGGVGAVVVVTTDKCYENREWEWGYRENDRLGGRDAYSASKAGAELVASSYRAAFFGGSGRPLVATARAGNVIGGGDWSEDRLVPDAVRAIAAGRPLEIRSPDARRPWQHVLEPLSGYLCLGERLLGGEAGFADAWNFGPGAEGNRTVVEVLTALQASWPALDWRLTADRHPHEAGLLQLDSSRARHRLKWHPVWPFDEAVIATARWYAAHAAGEPVPSRAQLEDYVACGRAAGLPWASYSGAHLG